MINKLESEVNKGKENVNTLKNKAIREAQEALNSIKYELNTAVAEVGSFHMFIFTSVNCLKVLVTTIDALEHV